MRLSAFNHCPLSGRERNGIPTPGHGHINALRPPHKQVVIMVFIFQFGGPSVKSRLAGFDFADTYALPLRLEGNLLAPASNSGWRVSGAPTALQKIDATEVRSGENMDLNTLGSDAAHMTMIFKMRINIKDEPQLGLGWVYMKFVYTGMDEYNTPNANLSLDYEFDNGKTTGWMNYTKNPIRYATVCGATINLSLSAGGKNHPVGHLDVCAKIGKLMLDGGDPDSVLYNLSISRMPMRAFLGDDGHLKLFVGEAPSSPVDIAISDIRGSQIYRSQAPFILNPGENELNFDPHHLASGTYYIKIFGRDYALSIPVIKAP